MFIEDEFICDSEKMVLYTYSTRHLTKKDKVRFYYALKGRDGKSGLVKEKQLIYLAKTVILATYRYDTEIQEFFKLWHIPFTKRHTVIGKPESIGYAQAV